jgi:hypothetical protein
MSLGVCLRFAPLLWLIPCFPQALAPEGKDSWEADIKTLQEKLRTLQLELDSLQKRGPPRIEPPPEVLPAPARDDASDEKPGHVPFDLSGYFSSRYVYDSRSSSLGSYQWHTASFFFSKTFGKWRFHSQVEFDYLPELHASGLPEAPAHGLVELEDAWVNYRHRDWLNGKAGLIFTPTYWRVHNYPSTTLTVLHPLIDEQIFPANIIGGMLHGSKYFGDGGFDYTLYAGNGRSFDTDPTETGGRHAVGGTFLLHVPTRHVFETFDLGVQRYGDRFLEGDRQRIYGFESKIEKGRMGFLGEFGHANVVQGGGERRYFREGYYLQPWFHIAPKIHLVYRYDRLNFDSRSPHESVVERHTAGATYRPVPVISFKLELHRYQANESVRRPHTGLAAGVAFFFP